MLGTTMDVGEWLRGLGLGRYEKEFREKKIDFDVLADLTEGDLEELRVPRGDRRYLLRAIAELRAQEAPSTRSWLAPATPASAPHSLALFDSAERRPVTIMFCDLVGSTALAAALDVEDWRSLLSAYLDAASEAVTQIGGRVAKRLGDGLMALFGHPIAQERLRTRGSRRAGHPADAHRTEPQERGLGPPEPRRPHRRRQRGGGGGCRRRNLWRCA
jgi:class 3 adenylate cyclase